MGYLNEIELKEIGLKKYGRNVLISNKCSIYGANNISIGDNVRIDDFCLLTAVAGEILLGNHIHIGTHSSLFGGSSKIEMQDFSGLSSYVCIYASSDNYDGNSLIGPTMLEDFREVISKTTIIGPYATCGSHAVVLPGANLGEGSILGAQSLATKPLGEWGIYSGIPSVRIKERQKGLLEKAKKMRDRWHEQY